jgi:hypothetical protein
MSNKEKLQEVFPDFEVKGYENDWDKDRRFNLEKGIKKYYVNCEKGKISFSQNFDNFDDAYGESIRNYNNKEVFGLKYDDSFPSISMSQEKTLEQIRKDFDKRLAKFDNFFELWEEFKERKIKESREELAMIEDLNGKPLVPYEKQAKAITISFKGNEEIEEGYIKLRQYGKKFGIDSITSQNINVIKKIIAILNGQN